MTKLTVNYLHSEELLSLVLAEETLIVLRADITESRFRELT